jgi:hypothetical protein
VPQTDASILLAMGAVKLMAGEPGQESNQGADKERKANR